MTAANFSLAMALGLRPLDRVQVNSRVAIEDTRLHIPLGRSAPWELPYYFFQRVVRGDQLELRSPGGCPCSVSPLDVCDIIPGEPVIVRAMPRTVFLERLKLHHANRTPPSDECYANALVLHAYKNRWGQVDAVVAFEDASLNADSSYMAPIHAEDRAGLERRAKRSVMPVLTGRGGANYSANLGVAQAKHADERVTSWFIRYSLKGRAAEADLLLAAGARHSVWSDLRKLQIAAREADE